MTECDHLKGRPWELCAGIGRDGRPNPSQSASDAYRARMGLEPIVVADPAPSSVTAKQPPVSQIGNRLSRYFRDRIGKMPCGWCAAQIARLNTMTPDQVKAEREELAAAIVENAKRNAGWALKLAVAADEALGLGQSVALVLSYIDEACEEESRAK